MAEYVARDNVGLVCDLWNVWQEPDIYASVAGSAPHLALVHVSDWRDRGPRRLNDRLVPGHGVIPLERWGALLRQVGYEGWVCLEMLSDRELEDSFYHRPVAEVVEESRGAMQAARLC